MRLIADENMPCIKALFSPFCDVEIFPGRGIDAAKIATADILLVRSVTKVDSNLLIKSQLKFVGSATIGLDHIDTQLLDKRGIQWAYAPGCNARAVGEYILTTLLHFVLASSRPPSSYTLGIVGYGNTGMWVAKLASVLGFNIVVCDPYKDILAYPNLEFEELLRQVDIVSFHTPLTMSNEFPTWHMADMKKLSQLKQGALIVNAARGSIINFDDLQQLLEERGDLQAVLDVWEPEPLFPSDLLPYVRLATPHIAGYSQEGKSRGTEMLFLACAKHFGWNIDHLQTNALPLMSYTPLVNTLDDLLQLLMTVCPVRRDDQMMRELGSMLGMARAEAFDRLRKEYPPRHEFWRYEVSSILPEMVDVLRLLGFDAHIVR